jgi:hypothetical protein
LAAAPFDRVLPRQEDARDHPRIAADRVEVDELPGMMRIPDGNRRGRELHLKA